MVFVKVRETYDLHTTQNKMTVIAIHTPKPEIIKRNYPGLLMQCRAYRPVFADVRLACASVLPLDPQGVGLGTGDVAPEDVFNPILYKAMSNKGMSQLEARINTVSRGSTGLDVNGQTAAVEVDNVSSQANEFDIYYGLLANTHDWKHASPQSGLSMTGLRPLVYEMVYNHGDNCSPMAPDGGVTLGTAKAPNTDNTSYPVSMTLSSVLGNAKEFPFLNCTSYSYYYNTSTSSAVGEAPAGFTGTDMPYNAEQDVPWMNVVCGAIIVPPSRLHELFYRMVVEWTLEFTAIRPISEILNWTGLSVYGADQHYKNYSYSKVKEVLTGSEETILENDACMVASNVDVTKVM